MKSSCWNARRRWRFWGLAAPLLAQILGLVAGLVIAVTRAPGLAPTAIWIVAAGFIAIWALPLLVQLVAIVGGLRALAAERSSNGRWWRILAEALLCILLARLIAIKLPWVALFVPANLYLALLAVFVRKTKAPPGPR